MEGPPLIPAQTATQLDFALYYASRGWPVFPLHKIIGEKCSCGAYACSYAGKHPRIKGGHNSASIDPDIIKAWWRKFQGANVGLQTGNGLIVIDVDPRHGGTESMASLPQLPETLETSTGGAGRHLLFSVKEKVPNSKSLLGPGIDIRGDGGYIVAPPSNHVSGGIYQWANSVDIAPLPEWVFTALKKPHHSALPPMPDVVIHGSRNDTLFKYAAKLRSQGLEYSEIYAALNAINENRCRPMLDAAELHTIASSASRYEPGTSKPVVVPVEQLSSDDMWKNAIICDQNSKPKKTAVNAGLYLQHDTAWNGKLVFDEFSCKYIWTDTLPIVPGMTPPTAGEAADHHYSYVQQWLLEHTQVTFPEAMVCSAITSAARQRASHPVREYLTSLVWDRIPRISRWLTTYLGVKDTPYARLVGKWWLISAVARIIVPGEKVDSLLILEGETGRGKSRSVGVLAGEWFSDTPIPLGNKDAYSNIQGLWIVELAELAALRGTGSNTAKAFFSSRSDRYRPAFERATRTFPRQCVFIGTTNDDEYLIDPTGGRRYWPVRCGGIDINALRRDRDQLWAEALELYETEKRWYPETDEEVALCKAEQDKRYLSDPWEEPIAEFVENRTETTISDVLMHLGVTRDKWDQVVQNRVSVCLKRLQWECKVFRREQKSVRIYTRTG
jgi:predicted P-loop ATPase